jgi:hypothetical protein
MTNVQGDQAPAKRQKMLKKSENSSMKTAAEQSTSWQTLLRPIMEFSRRSSQKIRTCAALLLHHDSNMVIIPHPPYTLDLAPCDFALFLKLKMKLK